MKFKKNLILLLILVVAAGVVVLIEKPFEDKTKKVRDEAELLFPALATEEIKKLSITQPSKPQPIILTKVDNTWFITLPDHLTETSEEEAKADPPPKEPYPVDENAVTEAIEKLKGLKAINLASKNKEKHELFEVNEGKAIEVTAFGRDDRELAVLYIGKAGPDFFSTYVRKKDAEEVYLYGQFLKGSFDRQPDNWRDRTMFNFDPDEVNRVKIATSDSTIVMQKGENNLWQLQEPKSCAADNAKVTMLLQSLSTLKGGKFADEATLESSGLKEPQTEITITFKDGNAKTLLIGDKQGENYFYAKTGDKKFIYELYKSTVEKLTPALEAVEKVESEPAPAPADSSPPEPHTGEAAETTVDNQ